MHLICYTNSICLCKYLPSKLTISQRRRDAKVTSSYFQNSDAKVTSSYFQNSDAKVTSSYFQNSDAKVTSSYFQNSDAKVTSSYFQNSDAKVTSSYFQNTFNDEASSKVSERRSKTATTDHKKIPMEDDVERGNGGSIGPQLLYSVEDTPPWYLCILLGFQVKSFQRAHDVYTTSAQRRCNVMTLHRR